MALVLAWQPPPPQPTLSTLLPPSFLNNPPATFVPGANAALNALLASWQPPVAAPILARNLPPSLTAVPVNNPPPAVSGLPYQAVLGAWQPGLPQPTLPAHVVQPGPVLSAFVANTSQQVSLVLAWQPAPTPPVLARNLPSGLLNVPVNAPPGVSPGLSRQPQVTPQWVFPDPPILRLNQRVFNNPAIINNPPWVNHSKTAQFATVLTQWVFPDPPILRLPPKSYPKPLVVYAANVPKLQSGVLIPTKLGPLALIPGGSDSFAQRELSRMQNMIEETIIMTPQSATTPPKVLKDGMKRLSRKPWWPVAGQVADQWVYWDAVGQVWRLLTIAPSTT